MTQNKNQFEIPPHPEAPLPHDVHENTLGTLAVQYANEAVAFDMHADHVEHLKSQAQELVDAKRRPDDVGVISRKVGRKTASVMTDEEFTFVNNVANMGVRATWYREDAAEKRKQALEEVVKVRQRIGELDEVMSEHLEVYMAENAPGFTVKSKTEVAPEESWKAWFVEKAEPNDILNFLHAHNDKLESQQRDPEIMKKIDVFRENYKQRMQELVANGTLPASVLDRLKRVDDIPVYLGDEFSTVMRRLNGHHTPGKGRIVIGVDLFTNPKSDRNAEDVFGHEMNHAIIQGRRKAQGWPRWLAEATTENLQAEPQTYLPERMLMAAMLQEGTNGPNHKLAYHAYAAQENNADVAAFENKIEEIWGDYIPAQKHALATYSAFSYIDMHSALTTDKLSADHPELSSRDVEISALLHTRAELRNNPEAIFGESSLVHQKLANLGLYSN